MMSGMGDRFFIEGGVPLAGSLAVRGSKNAASKLMVASLLTDQPSTIENVPMSVEIDITRELCEKIGSTVSAVGDYEIRIVTPKVTTSLVPELSRKNRIPILALGPLLHRAGVAEVPVLGGCPIGHRPIDFHVAALREMGVEIERREHSYYAEAQEIRGADIAFPWPSVGATESVILAAVLAKGRTRIENAAVEPEIMNLIEMLCAMGAKISVREAKRSIEVEGVLSLGGARIRVMPDRNEIVSFATAALATGGSVCIENIEDWYLKTFLSHLDAIGAGYEKEGSGMRFFKKGPFRPDSIRTEPHPGFMTDWQQQFLVVLTAAEGISIIHETVYEDRLGYTEDLRRMGAYIEVSGVCPVGSECRFFGGGYKHVARITGPAKLKGTRIRIPDLRAGMAHVVAALAAQGESVLEEIHHLDRGYEKIDERLETIGARIRRVMDGE